MLENALAERMREGEAFRVLEAIGIARTAVELRFL